MESIANQIEKRIESKKRGTFVFSANAVFITNGSPRKINVGCKKGILFKHSDNAHNFEYKSKEINRH